MWTVRNVSIHASRVGGDDSDMIFPRNALVSIHASRVGGDILRLKISPTKCQFQSTPPVWEATCTCAPQSICPVSIHASRVGGDNHHKYQCHPDDVSIHASRVGGDLKQQKPTCGIHGFNPTLPCGRRPITLRIGCGWERVSIHASRVGGDLSMLAIAPAYTCFNPRLPCGRRRAVYIMLRFL